MTTRTLDHTLTIPCAFGETVFSIEVDVTFTYDTMGDHEAGVAGPCLDDWDVARPALWRVISDPPLTPSSAEMFLCKSLSVLYPIPNELFTNLWDELVAGGSV
tara:strand:- start:32685 stop:32993 length:309 start_codon:yes stop_codon:yes gene_type:complete